jgi:hypothetical protein
VTGSVACVTRVRPDALQVGDEVVENRILPSDEGFRHVVDDVRDDGGGYVRVWFAVYEGDARRRGALEGREFFRWDKVYDVAGHGGGAVQLVEVVA